MDRYLSAIPGLLFVLATFLSGGGRAWAQTPIEPVQHVYPQSTLEEIQRAIDNGGTVYFHAGEYHQIRRNAPDLPPTSSDPAKGFNIGKYGKDVDIIGVPGPDGERPHIYGGTVAFRVGRFPSLGFTGLPVNFRIENLELFNPDLGSPLQIYSRIGVWVNLLGARSTIRNCKFTVTGKDTDPSHAMNHSVAIWFYLQSSQPQAPPSGAVIEIADNTVLALKTHEGIHADSFWPANPGFVPPRVLMTNNVVEVLNLNGFPNRSGTNGATLASAIILQGNLSNSLVANNTIRGYGRSPGLIPNVEAVGISLWSGSPADVMANATVIGNDTSGFTGDFQVRVGTTVSASAIVHNSFGPAQIAGVLCSGRDNAFVNNHFYGQYPGWSSSGVGPGLFWFDQASHGNTVEAMKLNAAPYGFEICGQIFDEAHGANAVPGYGRCQ
jgi:hypothetical protein